MALKEILRSFLTQTQGSSGKELMFGLPAAIVVSMSALSAASEVLEVESASVAEVLRTITLLGCGC